MPTSFGARMATGTVSDIGAETSIRVLETQGSMVGMAQIRTCRNLMRTSPDCPDMLLKMIGALGHETPKREQHFVQDRR